MEISIVSAIPGLLLSSFGAYILLNRMKLAQENSEFVHKWLGGRRNYRLSLVYVVATGAILFCGGLYEAIRALLSL
jgi:hypothetical protein